MKKQKTQVKKLKIGKETLLALQTKEVVGGAEGTAVSCYKEPHFNYSCICIA